MTKKILTIILVFGFFFSGALYALPQKVKVIDGVKYIKNPKKPNPPKGSPVNLTLTEEFSIGGGEKDEEVFSENIFINVDSEGNIYVADMKLNNIKVFDSSGAYIRTFGKEGKGPGELSMPTGIQITPDGDLMVEEVMNRRLSFFTPKGKFIKNVSTADKTSLTGLIVGPEGQMVGRELVVENGKMVWAIKKYDKDLKALFTVDKVDFPNPLQGKINPFDLMIIFDVGRDGNIIYGTSKEYEIKFISPEGKHIKSITKKYNPVKITEKDKSEIMDRLPETGTVNLKERIELPKYYPAFQNFTMDEEGRIFVRTFEKGKKEDQYILDIFDPKGNYISQIPLKVNPVLWKNGKLFSTEESEQGFIVIKCYEVHWEST